MEKMILMQKVTAKIDNEFESSEDLEAMKKQIND